MYPRIIRRSCYRCLAHGGSILIAGCFNQLKPSKFWIAWDSNLHMIHGSSQLSGEKTAGAPVSMSWRSAAMRWSPQPKKSWGPSGTGAERPLPSADNMLVCPNHHFPHQYCHFEEFPILGHTFWIPETGVGYHVGLLDGRIGKGHEFKAVCHDSDDQLWKLY